MACWENPAVAPQS